MRRTRTRTRTWTSAILFMAWGRVNSGNQIRFQDKIGIKGDSTANLSSLCRDPSSRWKRDRDTNRNDPWRSFGWWHQLKLCQLPQIVEELRIVAPAVGGLGVPQFGKTCLKLHSLLIFPPCMCVCVCRYLKFDIASIVQFMANLLSARKTGAVQCNCLSVSLRAQRIYDSLSYWNEYLFVFIMYSLLWQAQQHPSVALKWNRDVNNVDYSTPISKAEERSVEVNWLTFDNRSCLCEYANHIHTHTCTRTHTCPRAEQNNLRGQLI